jgi:phage/plasmid-like protein (TIGR03299 family)
VVGDFGKTTTKRGVETMPANIAQRSDGQGVAMAYVEHEGAPWHQLGRALSDPMTAREAISEGGLDYEVVSLPMFARVDQAALSAPGMPAPTVAPPSEIAVPSHYLNVRTDDYRSLGVVSDRYRVIQNRDAFDFLDSVAAERELRYHTVGAIGDGERIWMLARLTGDIEIRGTGGRDIVHKYLLLYNSHDGSSALRCLWTPTRVVCWNTLSAALSAGEGTGVTIRHTGDVEKKVDLARTTLGLAHKFFEAFGEGANLLSGYTPSKDQIEAYFRALYPDPKVGDPAKTKAIRMSLWGLFDQGMGQDLPGVRGTAWAGLNSVTEYVDHHVGSNPRARLESSWWGDGAKMKVRAFDLALKMLT